MLDILKQKLDEIPRISSDVPEYAQDMGRIFKEGGEDELLGLIDTLEDSLILLAATKPRSHLTLSDSRTFNLGLVEEELNKLTPCEDISTSFIFI